MAINQTPGGDLMSLAVVSKPSNAPLRLNGLRILILYLVLIQFRQHVPRITTNRHVSRKLRPQSLNYRIASWICRKIKRLAVENHAYTDHENNIRRVSKSTGAKFSCVTVSKPAMAVVSKASNAQLRLNRLRILILYLVLIQFCIIPLCKSVSFPRLIH